MEDAASETRIALLLDILLAGTARPGKEIGHASADIIREVRKITSSAHAGITMPAVQRELGSANNDHDIARGLRTLEEIIGQPVTCLPLRLACRPESDRSKRSVPFAIQRSSWCYVLSIALIRKPLHRIFGDLTTWDEAIGRDVKNRRF